jgi:hypothetical protein
MASNCGAATIGSTEDSAGGCTVGGVDTLASKRDAAIAACPSFGAITLASGALNAIRAANASSLDDAAPAFGSFTSWLAAACPASSSASIVRAAGTAFDGSELLWRFPPPSGLAATVSAGVGSS